ncbi:M15 family metallopeptidase [candidate division KSB1 bacterium]|nr:M15 family metallopeptidase [candidate division KSB1 bacterium]
MINRLFFALLLVTSVFTHSAFAAGILTGTDFFTRNDSLFLEFYYSGDIFPRYEYFQNNNYAVYFDDCKNLLDLPLPEMTEKRYLERMDWINLPSVISLTFKLSEGTHFDITARNTNLTIVIVRTPEASAPDSSCLIRYDDSSKKYSAWFGPIPQHILKEVYANSWRDNCPVGPENLAFLRLTHWGMDGNIHTGELIVHRGVSLEVLDIFQELFEGKFFIEKMQRIDIYRGDDNLSMTDNNTSAFNCRTVTFGDELSNHAYGIAIDINPVMNPYVYRNGTRTLPPNGRPYIKRNPEIPGLIHRDGSCYRAFTRRGWSWGGDWNRIKDYQHFEKVIEY